MNHVGKIRLTALRVFYFLSAVSFVILASFDYLIGDTLSDGLQAIIRAVFYAVALLSAVGVLHPLKMLPLLLFSVAWKFIWLLAFVFPMYTGSGLDTHTINSLIPALSGLVVTLCVIPWKYTMSHYFTFNP
ncbi:MAG TPA: hypothetical protein VIC08_14180 [Cellvibrionaceae bacterium]